ncbi:FdhF/YdeP family oxidoreductase [Gemmatimonas sp.]|uniref:FdhF/YdeP family oxidoreductase n=1 Tax=Gemmatimonas sp. TaxID=1962908 RepID=UPI003568674D
MSDHKSDYGGNHGNPSFLSPEVLDAAIRVGTPSASSGGLPAVTVALTMAIKQMGVSRTMSSLLDLNQEAGFDCPGCAWPDPDGERSRFEFCENGAKAVAEEATRERVTAAFFAEHSVAALAERSDYWLGKRGRLTEPMYLPKGGTHYQPITWDAAFDLIGRELNALASPHEAVFYTSGRTSNEAAFLYQLFVRQFGTNNLPDCSNMCHESSGVGMLETLGTGKGSVSLADFELADCILVIGQNPGTNHPRMLSTLQRAARRGCRIVSINPLEESGLKRFKHPQEVTGVLGSGTALATDYLPVRINGDVALLKGIQKAMIESHAECIDHAFIGEYTDGFVRYCDDLAAESWGAIAASSGIAESRIREIAAVIASSKTMICCWAMGVTQHQNAVANVKEIVNLLLLGGHVGKPGAGACPVRGHSNVQGDRTMGIWERPTQTFLDQLGAEFDFTPPSAHGFDVVHAIEAMHQRRAHVFIALGGNFLSAAPDTAYTAQALRQCRLTVQVSTKLNRSHLLTGERALILPCLGRTERDLQAGGAQVVTVENSMGIVHGSHGHLAPASEQLRSEPAIVAGMARATLGVDWSGFIADYDTIRDRIARVIPGFDNMNARVREPGGFALPHGVRDRREFATTNGRAQFTVHPIPQWALESGQLMMMTIRSHDQFNTTIYGLDDRYRGISNGRRVVLLNADDIAAQGFSEGEAVDIVSHFRGVQRRAQNFRIVTYAIPRGCAATYFPETNVLVPIDSVAAGSRTPTSKSVIISLERALEPALGHA